MSNLPHPAIDRVHNEPTHSAGYTGLRECVVYFATRLQHAIDKDSENGRDHNKPLEPEELVELIRAEETEYKMNQPKDKEG